MGNHVFICYSREDGDFVLKLATNLKSQGIPVWLDQWNIHPATIWNQKIGEAISECASLLVILSPASVASKEVEAEWIRALHEKKTVITVLYRSCDIPSTLNPLQYVDFTLGDPDDKTALDQVLLALTKANSTSPKITDDSIHPVFVPHLPSPPRDFTGRDEELQDLLAGFDRGATITGLRGMGGIGKTALAYALAEKLTKRYPDGQILIELMGTDPVPMTPAEAMARVIRAYYPEFKPPESEAELANIYHSVLHGMRALLLLDDAADDGQVRPLLPPQGCGVIVTSRRKFSIPGLVPMDLDVLRMDKAVELLLKLWKPGAPPSAEGLGDEDLLEIARLCGFLPLALRAAGSLLANSPDLSLAQYARDLRDERKRLKRIGKEGVDLDVESSLGLSYSRLKPETAAVFRILSIFPASFDSTAEEVVCQDEDHRILSELVRWSLVDYQLSGVEIEGRYHLHDLVRIFAAGRLVEAGGGAASNDAQQRHAEHFKDVLSSATELYQNGDTLSGLRKFDLERMNIEVGWAWAKNNLASKNAAASLCNAFLNAPYLLELRMHPKEWISWQEKALVAARQLKDNEMEGVHLGNLGSAYICLGEPGKAIEYYDQALKISREIGGRRGERSSLGCLGLAYAALGETRKAIEYYDQALKVSREIGDRRGEAFTCWNLGLEYEKAGDLRQAADLILVCIEFEKEISHIDAEKDAKYLENLRARLEKK